MARDLVAGWQGGPFTAFLRGVAALESLWPRFRGSGGVVGRLLARGDAAAIDAAEAHAAIDEIGLGEGDVEQSRSILVGLAARARIEEPLVGRARLAPGPAAAAEAACLERTRAWLSRGIAELSDARRGRPSLAVVRVVCELVFASIVVAVLWRAGRGFFYDRLWKGLPTDTGGFLWESLFWLAVLGFALRWVLFREARRGIDRDVGSLVAGIASARCVDPVLEDFAAAARAAADFLEAGDRLASETSNLAGRFAEPAGELGRLRRESPAV